MSELPPLKTAEYVDIAKFMGDWYVIGNIPTFIEKQAYNAVESYEMKEDGRIATTFTFNKGSFDGEQKTYHPTGFVQDTASNAIWGMQFIWPIKADYRIVHVDDDYQETIIGRNKRDYVWIMARTPVISASDYDRLLNKVQMMGYDIDRVRRVPQQAGDRR